MRRINHEEAYSLNGACTNWAEEYFSRLRRAEAGHYHHLAGDYLLRHAQEASWREDHRRMANGDQFRTVLALVAKNKPSRDFCGYWQRQNRAISGVLKSLEPRERSSPASVEKNDIFRDN